MDIVHITDNTLASNSNGISGYFGDSNKAILHYCGIGTSYSLAPLPVNMTLLPVILQKENGRAPVIMPVIQSSTSNETSKPTSNCNMRINL